MDPLHEALKLIDLYQAEINARDDLIGFCQGSYFEDVAMLVAQAYADQTGDRRYVKIFTAHWTDVRARIDGP